MARDKVLPAQNCFCAFVKRDVRSLADDFSASVRDRDCTQDLYIVNYDKPIDDNMEKVAMKYAPDKDILLITPLETQSESMCISIYIFLMISSKYSASIFRKYIRQIYSANIFGKYIPHTFVTTMSKALIDVLLQLICFGPNTSGRVKYSCTIYITTITVGTLAKEIHEHHFKHLHRRPVKPM